MRQDDHWHAAVPRPRLRVFILLVVLYTVRLLRGAGRFQSRYRLSIRELLAKPLTVQVTIKYPAEKHSSVNEALLGWEHAIEMILRFVVDDLVWHRCFSSPFAKVPGHLQLIANDPVL